MIWKQFPATVLVMALSALDPAVGAQQQDLFKVRLSPVPIDATMRNDVTGSGSASAVLVANRLTITGSFEGLRGPATAARLHQGPRTGIRGSVIGELTVSPALAGRIAGSVELTSAQIAGLQKGAFYIQIHSEKAPDGNLWGWLLK